ncbi:MAG: S1C family serine protease [Candidatus Moranbacteria bacterium]|nr:S1C family serine protease [Candidatus Moranbacteria bacterium]
MVQKSIKKYSFIVLSAAGVFVLGGFGGVIFDRYIIPELSTYPFVTRSGLFKKLTERVTVINKTEQVVIREDDTVEKIISQPATAVVNIIALTGENNTAKKERASATGVLITNDGLVVTYSENPFGNGDLRYAALLFDGTSKGMVFVGYDPLTNLSFFRLNDAANTPAIALANSDDARVGKKLIALGNGFAQYQNRLAVSTLGSVNRIFNLSGKTVASSEKWEGVFEIDLAAPESFIGGPAVSMNGEMVGLIGTLTIDNVVHTFLIPSNVVRESFDHAVNGTLGMRPVFGVYYLSITKALALEQGLARDHGALVYSPSGKTGLAVLFDSPAMKAGLLAGDIIEAVNDKEITLDQPLPEILSGFNKGDSIELLILRNGEEKKISVTL